MGKSKKERPGKVASSKKRRTNNQIFVDNLVMLEKADKHYKKTKGKK
jgi:hypothetical protein